MNPITKKISKLKRQNIILKTKKIKAKAFEESTNPQKITKKNMYALLEADKALIQNPTELHDFTVLYQYLPVIFPTNSYFIAKMIINNKRLLESSEKQFNHLYVGFLPRHINSNEWLIKYVENTMRQKAPQENIQLSSIQKFVRQSVNFAAARNNFKQKYIRTNITEQMKIGKDENHLFHYRGWHYFARHGCECDRLFREHLRAGMTIRGIDYRSVQLGIEANADLWRDQAMNQSFKNWLKVYFEAIKLKDLELRKIDVKILIAFIQAYQKNWKKIRLHEYYQHHREFIDELDLSTPGMMLSAKKVEQLKQKNERMREILEHFLYKNHEREDKEEMDNSK